MEDEENFASTFDVLGKLGEEMDFITEENVATPEKGTKTIKSLPNIRRQYSTRGKKHSYCEPKVPNDDHYICELTNDSVLTLVVVLKSFLQYFTMGICN